MKRNLIGLICVALPAVGLAACNGNSDNGSSEENQTVITEAEASELAVPDGAKAEIVIDGINSEKFRVEDNMLLSENYPIVIDFYATWCGPCRTYSPIFHAIAEKFKDVAIFVRIDTDQNPEIANAYGVKAIPTTAFVMPGGGVLGQQTGVLSAGELENYINQLVATTAGDDAGI